MMGSSVFTQLVSGGVSVVGIEDSDGVICLRPDENGVSACVGIGKVYLFIFKIINQEYCILNIFMMVPYE